MQNLEEIKEAFLTEYDGCCLGATQATSDANKKDILDYWLKKWQERELALWQAMEEKKKEIVIVPGIFTPTQDKVDESYNIGISEAQSLLSVKEKEV